MIGLKNEKIFSRFLLLLFFSALMIRGFFFLLGPSKDITRSMTPDSGRYLLLADNLKKFGTFGKQFEDGIVHQKISEIRAQNGTLPSLDKNGLRSEVFRTPGYPLILMGLKRVFLNEKAAILLQCLLGAFLACLVSALSKQMGVSTRGSMLMGLLWAFHPAIILHDLLIMTESIFNTFFILSVYLIVQHKSWLSVISSGLLLGYSSLIRPLLGILFLPSILLLMRGFGRTKFFRVIALIVLTILPSLLWSVRNQVNGEGFQLTSVGAVNLLFYTVAYSISEERGEAWSESWLKRVEELAQELSQRVKPKQDVFKAMWALAFKEVKDRPFMVMRVHLKSWLKLFLDHSLGEFYHVLGKSYVPSGLFSRIFLKEPLKIKIHSSIQLAIAFAWMILNFAIVVGALCGIVVAISRFQWCFLLFCLLIVTGTVMITSCVGLERFRMPMMLPLFLLVCNILKNSTVEVKSCA